MAAISIILPILPVSDASDKLKRNKKYEDLLSLISREHKAYGYSYEAYFLKSDIVSKLFVGSKPKSACGFIISFLQLGLFSI
jgi:hypothetical protein